MSLGMEVGLGANDILLDWEPAPPKRGHNSPTFRPMHCGQTAGWIMMPLGTEVGLGPGHTVLDGDPALPRKGKQQPPLFGLRLLWPNGRPSQQRLSSCCVAGSAAILARAARVKLLRPEIDIIRRFFIHSYHIHFTLD